MINEQTREDEILQYLPLVEKVVNGLRIKSTEYERGDLINFGVIGLMDALKKYQPNKVSFESYAYTRIRGAIIDEIRSNAPVSRTGMDKLKRYYRVKEELEQELKRIPTEQEISQKLDFTTKQFDEIYDIMHRLSAVSLEQVIYAEEGSQTELGDFIEDDDMLVEEEVLENEQKADLIKAIGQLPQRDQEILQLYYVEQLPLKEIAFIYDISVPRVSQIHGKAIGKLRDEMRRMNLD